MKKFLFALLISLVLVVTPSYALVTSQNPRTSYVAGGGVGDVNFTYSFKIFQSSDLQVYDDDVLQTLNVHYTVSMNPGGIGGTVTFVTAPAAASIIDIVRSIPITQSMDLQEGQRLPAETLESAFDKDTMILQDMDSKLSLLLAGGGITPIDTNTILAMLGYIDVRRYASINAAVSTLGSMVCTLLVPNAQTLTANLITPSTMTVIILNGGSVSLGGFSWTKNGPVIDFSQSFTINTDGDVGIGTHNPVSILEIQSQSGGDPALDVKVDTGHVDGLRSRFKIENNPDQPTVDMQVRGAELTIGSNDPGVSSAGTKLAIFAPIGDTSIPFSIYKSGDTWGGGALPSIYFGRNGDIVSQAFGLASQAYGIKASTDTTYRFAIIEASPSFKLVWGPGEATAVDTNLYRSAANTLKTDDRFVAGGGLSALSFPIYANNAAALAGGLIAGDFYRTGADPDPVCVVH